MAAEVSSRELRRRFAQRLSAMYATEVPLYGQLLEVVHAHNRELLEARPELATGEDLESISAERHGAIRVARGEELRAVARLFRVLGMHPVGFYDLSAAPPGKRQPVISTAFRPVEEAEIEAAPFRMFCSLLLSGDRRFFDAELGARIEAATRDRRLLTPELEELIGQHENSGALPEPQAERFLELSVAVFAWDRTRRVPKALYEDLLARAPIAADVILEPHLNHLTPRSLDIDELHRRMSAHAVMKDEIEGPPPGRDLVLLRQTSYRALEEVREFETAHGEAISAAHRARFGEIEQRGAAMTPEGRALYDEALAARAAGHSDAVAFARLPGSYEELRRRGLISVRYSARKSAGAASGPALEDLLAGGHLAFSPLRYEDFLPVSAAGIFGSNLEGGVESDGEQESTYVAEDLERHLGRPLLDPYALYAASEARSLRAALEELGVTPEAETARRIESALANDPTRTL